MSNWGQSADHTLVMAHTYNHLEGWHNIIDWTSNWSSKLSMQIKRKCQQDYWTSNWFTNNN